MSSVEDAGMASKIHLFDLARQNMPIADELLAAVAQVAGAQGFVLGAGLCIALSGPIARLTTIRFTLLAPFLFMLIAFAVQIVWA